MISRLIIVLVVLGVTGASALWWKRRDGLFTEGHGRFSWSELGLARRDRPSAVLVEFSGEGCAPCEVLRGRIEALSEHLPDVAIVTIDAGEHLDLASRYGVKRVPTLFVTDGSLQIRWRAAGLPSEHDLKSVLLGPDWAGRPHPAERVEG